MDQRGRGIVVDRMTKRRRDLPHWEAPDATYFVTFKQRRPPAADLTEPALGQIVVNALRFLDGRKYILFDYTVMPDHVHLILRPLPAAGSPQALWRITGSLKSWLARRINEIAGRRGPLWQDESYDHILRDQGDYLEKAAYIYDNPRRKGLVDDPAKWPWWGIGSGGQWDGSGDPPPREEGVSDPGG